MVLLNFNISRTKFDMGELSFHRNRESIAEMLNTRSNFTGEGPSSES